MLYCNSADILFMKATKLTVAVMSAKMGSNFHTGGYVALCLTL